MEGEETLTIRLPTKVSITYEFKNPFKDSTTGRTKFSIDVEIFLTKDEAEILDKELLDVMVQALRTIFEAKKLEQFNETIEEATKDIFDADPA